MKKQRREVRTAILLCNRFMRKHFKKTAAIVSAAAMLASSAMPAFASAVDNYILFLPKTDLINYEIDDEHVSDEYTTDKYAILFYKPGELVELEANTDQRFYIEDALETTVYSSYETAFDGKIRFIMPEEDILLVIKDEDGNVIDADAEESQEADAAVQEAREEPADPEIDETEEETEEETESETETSAESGNAANGNHEHVHGKPGTITLKLFGNIKADVTIVGNTEETVLENGSLNSEKNIDIMTITSDGGNWNNPGFYLYQDGVLVEDTSKIIINNGGWNGKYLIDLKNSWDMGDSAWTFEVIEDGYTVPEDADTGGSMTEERDETAEVSGQEGNNRLKTRKVSLDDTEKPFVFSSSYNPKSLLGVDPPEPEETVEQETAHFNPRSLLGIDPPKTEENTADVPVVKYNPMSLLGVDPPQNSESEAVPKEYAGVLDESIPSNFIPVPGKEDIYMVLDDIGIVVNYMQRVKNGNDWEWEELFPGIADVPGEDDLYMISNPDGSVNYFKYTRNPDNSYVFAESDEEGNILK